jgi:hypothetical protein
MIDIVCTFLPSGDHWQYADELDLHIPIFLVMGISQISISPLRLPKPAKQRNLPCGFHAMKFLLSLPNSNSG